MMIPPLVSVGPQLVVMVLASAVSIESVYLFVAFFFDCLFFVSIKVYDDWQCID